MSLNAQQKAALAFQLAELVEHEEPAAFLLTLHRMAETQAFREARARAYNQALAWQTIAESVSRVRLKLLDAQSSSEPI